MPRFRPQVESLEVRDYPSIAYAVVGTAHEVIKFDTGNPEVILDRFHLKNLHGNEMRAMDFRPANNKLYGLIVSKFDFADVWICQIDTESGRTRRIGKMIHLHESSGPVGMDFDPTTDRIRIISAYGGSYLVNPDTGKLIKTNPELPPEATVNFVAYAQNGKAFGIDSEADVLVAINTKTGNLTTIGSLGFNTDIGGFDIGPDGTAYAFLRNGSDQAFFGTVNLDTGTFTTLGLRHWGIESFAVSTESVPAPPDQWARCPPPWWIKRGEDPS